MLPGFRYQRRLEPSGKASWGRVPWELGLEEWICIWRETRGEGGSAGEAKGQECIQQWTGFG